MNNEQLIELIQEYRQAYVDDVEAMAYDDPTLYDYAEGILDACDFVLSKLQ
jgi:hypothetical protein